MFDHRVKKSPYIREEYVFDELFGEFTEEILNTEEPDFASVYYKYNGINENDVHDTDMYSILSPFMNDIDIAINYKSEQVGEYYVYFAICDSDVVYIGSGKGDRYKHVNSGTSSCWLLNKLYFQNKTIICVRVVKGLTKEDSMSIEQILVESIKPLGNKSIGNKGVERKHLKGRYDELLEKFGKELEIMCYDFGNDPINGMPKPRTLGKN